MAKDQKTLFKDAEAVGQLKSQPVVPEPDAPKAHEAKIIDNPTDFQYAVGKAQMAMQEGDGEDFVEVSKELFEYLVKNQKTRYITYGSPGVKVYLAGTREECEITDSLSAEEYHTREIRARSNRVKSVIG